MSAVRTFGTGYQVTTVEPADAGGWRWTREPGRDNEIGMPDLPAGLDRAAAEAEIDGVRFVLPEEHEPDRVAWRTRGAVPFAEVVRSEPETPEARDGVRRLVAAAASWHARMASTTPRGLAVAPPGLLRLRAWLVDGSGTRASGPFHARLRSALGAARWELLRDAVESLLLDGAEDRQPVHGWFSLGNVLLTPQTDDAPPMLEVLTGTDLASGLPEFDLGCLIGELEEFGALAVDHGGSRLGHLHLGTLARSCYSGELHSDLLARGVAVRVALHSRDFASFVGWYDDLDRYIPMVAELVDTIEGA